MEEHWFLRPKGKAWNVPERAKHHDLLEPICGYVNNLDAVEAAKGYWEGELGLERVILIRFRHGIEPKSWTYSDVVVEVIEGSERRHETKYYVTRLNVLKLDLGAVYEEISHLLWFDGHEPKSAYNKVYLHRVMYTWLTGCSLFKQHVHHLSRSGVDNRLENLWATSESLHGFYHSNEFQELQKLFKNNNEEALILYLNYLENDYPHEDHLRPYMVFGDVEQYLESEDNKTPVTCATATRTAYHASHEIHLAGRSQSAASRSRPAVSTPYSSNGLPLQAPPLLRSPPHP